MIDSEFSTLPAVFNALTKIRQCNKADSQTSKRKYPKHSAIRRHAAQSIRERRYALRCWEAGTMDDARFIHLVKNDLCV